MSLHHDLSGFSSYKKRQCLILFGCVFISLASIYYLSPYWAAHQLLTAFEAQDTPAIKKQIPNKLLLHIIPNLHPEQQWQGAGSHYLKNVWPRLYVAMNHAAWLSIQAQVLRQDNASHYYEHYFNRYALDLGSDHDQIRIEFERVSFLHWQVKRVCYPNPQPDWVVNRCPSSKR